MGEFFGAPFIVEGSNVFQRRLPDGAILGQWSLASPIEAERFVLERVRQIEMKGYQIGDTDYGGDGT